MRRNSSSTSIMTLVMTAAVCASTTARTAAAQTSNVTAGGIDPFAVEAPAGSAYAPSEVRILVNVDDRRLYVVVGGDTVRTATVSVASGKALEYAGRRWRFDAPRGVLKVRGKRTDPVWQPPDWHYAEVASTHGLQLRVLPRSGYRLSDGSRLVVRDSVVGVVMPGDSTFNALPIEEHIIFDNTLFVPPTGTHNRYLSGELGKYALDLGNGYLLHGTNDQTTIGQAVTHGCIRLSDEDLEWIYQRIPVGATVVVF